jgi:co-chaperonin GroES (HSP10)
MIQATNNFVFIIRDEAEKETNGLFIPEQGVEKPSQGTIYSVGELVQDKSIQKDKKAVFMKGNGQEIKYKGETYLVLDGDRIIGVDDNDK